MILLADSEGPDQTVWMRRLIWAFVVRICPKAQPIKVFFDFQGWGMYAQLLIDLFKFLSPFLRNADLTKPTHFLYKVIKSSVLQVLAIFGEILTPLN